MHADEDSLVEAIACAIADHLRSHPRAADSAGGVARWWLEPAHASATLEQVERALDLLVERGVLRRLRLMDGTELYSQTTPTPH